MRSTKNLKIIIKTDKKTRLNISSSRDFFYNTRHAVSVVYNLLYGRMVIASQVRAPFVRKSGRSAIRHRSKAPYYCVLGYILTANYRTRQGVFSFVLSDDIILLQNQTFQQVFPRKPDLSPGLLYLAIVGGGLFLCHSSLKITPICTRNKRHGPQFCPIHFCFRLSWRRKQHPKEE